MRTNNHFQRIMSSVVILTFIFSSLPLYAQSSVMAKPLNTGFLFDFAQKLVDRGEVREAQLVLRKILRSDPENSSVKRLLKNLEEQKNPKDLLVFKTTKPSDIAADIMYIQKNIAVLEKRNRELEFDIRKMLQENIFFYQTLSRRNHELLELRKKFLGYEGKAGAAVQATENTDEVLKTYEKQIVERDRAFLKSSQEIGKIMKDVGKTGELLNINNDEPQMMDHSDNALEWKNDLTEKRSFLVEKALALFDKNKDLSALHTELSAVSKSLKEANDNSGETVEEFEAKIQKLNNVWVQDKAKQQSNIDRLKDQIKNEKVKSFSTRLTPSKEEPLMDENVKPKTQSVKENAAFPNSYKSVSKKPAAMKSENESNDITHENNKAIKAGKSKSYGADSQLEISRLENELASKEQELKERSHLFDAKIRELKTSWAKEKTVEQQSRAFNKSNGPIDPEDEDTIKQSYVYKDVIQELDYIKDQLNMKEDQVNKFQDEMAGHTFQLDELHKKLASRESQLTQMDALIISKDQQIAVLKKELVLKIQEIRQKSLLVNELQAKLSPPQTGIKDLSKRVVAVKNTGDLKKQPVDELKDLVAELENQLGTDEKSKGPAEDLRQQLAGSLEVIQQKDKEIQELKAKLENDNKLNEFRDRSANNENVNEQFKAYQKDIADLKSQLADSVKQREEAENKWEKANQRLVDMAREMKNTEDSSSSSNKRINDFVNKIEELNGQLKEQSGVFSIQLESLRDRIALKNQEISSLKEKLADKDNQVQQFYASMEMATQKLNATTSARQEQKPDSSTTSSIKGRKDKVSSASKNAKDWDPADNDAYSLQQRLKTLGKELQYTQDQLAARNKEAGELNQELAEKESRSTSQPASSRGAKSGLEKEIAMIKQQSDLTKTTIKLQQENLTKAQKAASQKERALKTTVDQLNKMRRQVDDYKSTIHEKDEQIELQKKALDHETKKNDVLTRKLKDINKTISAEAQQDGMMNQSADELKSSVKTYEIRERDFKKQINDIQDQLKSSYVMIEDGESRIKVLKQRLSAREERINELEEELNRQNSEDNQVLDAVDSGSGK